MFGETLFNLAIFLVFLGFLMYVLPKSLHLFYFSDDIPKNKQGYPINSPINITNFLKFHAILIAFCITLFSIFIGFHSDIIAAYDKNEPSETENDVNWHSPYQISKFPIDQLKYKKEEQIEVYNCDMANPRQDTMNYYNIVFSDFSLSTAVKNADSSVYALSTRIYQRLRHPQECAFLNDSLTLKERVPLLLLFGHLRSLQHQPHNNFGFFYYTGFYKISPLFNQTWQSLRNQSFCNSETDSLSTVEKYNDFMNKCRRELQDTVARDRNGNGRTDFEFIANAIYDTLKKAGINNVAKNYISLTIISDFLHDATLQGYVPVPMPKVKSALSKLFKLKCIKQVNLMIVPTKDQKAYSQDKQMKIKELIDLFKHNDIYTIPYYLNLFDPEMGKYSTTAADEILAISTNYKNDMVPDPTGKINFYYPFKYYSSKHSMSSLISFNVDPIVYGEPESDQLLFKLRSAYPSSNDIRLEFEKKGEDSRATVEMDKFTPIKIMNQDTFTCNLNFNGAPPETDIYLDVYSPNKFYKKSILLSCKPRLPHTTSVNLILVYTLLFSSVCIYLLTFIYELYRIKHSTRYNYLFLSLFILYSIVSIYIISSLLNTYQALVTCGYSKIYLVVTSIPLVNGALAIIKYKVFVRKCKELNADRQSEDTEPGNSDLMNEPG